MRVRPFGVLLMEDEHGPDERSVSVPAARLTRGYDGVHGHSDLPEITRRRIEHFFAHYKDLEEGSGFKIAGWDDVQTARRLIAAAS